MSAPSSTALAVPGPNRLAHAFLALAGDEPPAPVPRSVTRGLAALAAVAVLALAAPLGWVATQEPPDQPAALGSSSKAVLAADDEDDGPG
jgi:hypothetical protein